MKETILAFLEEINQNKIKIYNEFSLQHELGIYLRFSLTDHKIEFERNVKYFDINKKTTKKEIDITIEDNLNECKYAIELKFPRNGEYPEQMFSMIKDIRFMEEIKDFGIFTNNFVLCIVKDDTFYIEKNKATGIYRYFRNGETITGEIKKPTGKKEPSITIKGEYSIKWEELDKNEENYHYFLLEI